MSGVVGHKEKLLFCQVDANLDTNPKIVAAGGYGAAVFQFILRRIKVLGTDGWVRARDIDPDYLASQLRFPASEMLSGVSAAVRAGLITDIADNGRVHVVGWSEEWDGFRRTRKEPKEETEAEREAKLKKERDRKAAARAKSKSSESDDSHVSASADVRACPGLSGVSAAVRRADSVSGVSVQQEIERRGDREEREEVYIRMRERHPDAGRIAHEVWQYACAKSNELRAANVNAPPWPLVAGGEHTGWKRLLDRIGEALVGSDADAVRKRVRNRVDVAAAKARADGKGGYFTPSAMFTRESFDAFADLDPTEVARKPAAANKRGAGDEIRTVNIL